MPNRVHPSPFAAILGRAHHALAFLLLALAVLALFTPPAFAQDSGTSVDFGPVVSGLIPYVVEILGGVLMLVALWLAAILKKKLGIDIESGLREIEAKHRETLHWALHTGITSALQRAGISDPSNIPVNVRNKLVADAIRYARDKGAPEAIAYFGADPDSLIELALSKLAAFAGVPPVVNVAAPASA